MSPVIRQFSCILKELGKYNSIKHSISLKNEKKKNFLIKEFPLKEQWNLNWVNLSYTVALAITAALQS